MTPYRIMVYRADTGRAVAMPEGGVWKPVMMTQGLSSGDTGGSPLVTILWQLVHEGPVGGFEYPSAGKREYPPGHEGEAAFRHEPEYSGEIGDCPPGDLGNEIR